MAYGRYMEPDEWREGLNKVDMDTATTSAFQTYDPHVEPWEPSHYSLAGVPSRRLTRAEQRELDRLERLQDNVDRLITSLPRRNVRRAT